MLQLSERLGQRGVLLHELARGARVRALVLAQASLTFEEEMELDETVEELEPLSFLLGRLLDQLCARLESRALAVQTIRVWFELEPSFEKDVQALKDESRKKTAPKEFVKVLTLPVAMRDAKVLLKLLRLSLQSDAPKSPIQKIRMTADAAAPRVAQSGLFVPRGPDPEKLELTVARLAKLVGKSNVGVAELIDTHRAENFRVARWTCGAIAGEENGRGRRANSEETCCCAEVVQRDASRSGTNISAAGFRVLRPPLVATVEVDADTSPVARDFSGMRGDVIAASGPWRSSGEWWQEDGWDHDEWDLAIDFGEESGAARRKAGRHCCTDAFRASANSGVAARTKILEPSPWPRHGVYRIFYDLPRSAGSCGDFTISALRPHVTSRTKIKMYIELHARSAFSFLEGSSIPEEMVAACAERGMGAMAVLDRDGVYGAPRFYHAAKKKGIRAHIGAEITIPGGMAFSAARRIARRLPESVPRDHADEIARAKKAKATSRQGNSTAP